jgi:processing peptidase subunit beta
LCTQLCIKSLLSSHLSDIIAKHNLANSYMPFSTRSTSYSDTGLWGIYLVSENLTNLDDLMHFTLRKWTHMSITHSGRVEHVKSQLKARLLLILDGTTAAIAEDIGRQLVTSGQRMTPRQIEKWVFFFSRRRCPSGPSPHPSHLAVFPSF